MQNQEKSSLLDQGVAQIGIIVKDLDATVKRYHEVFGISPWHIYTYEKPLVKEMTYYTSRNLNSA